MSPPTAVASSGQPHCADPRRITARPRVVLPPVSAVDGSGWAARGVGGAEVAKAAVPGLGVAYSPGAAVPACPRNPAASALKGAWRAF